MSKNGVSALERGYRRTPQRETLALLAGALALDDAQRVAFEAAAARWELLPREKESSITVGPWPGTGRSALPLALTRFVGRDVELAEIASLVREHRLVTVTGPGGVGKTQTALRVAATLDQMPDLAPFFIALALLRDPSLVVAAIASALGLQEVPNHPLLETLLTYLKNKSLLLILDNCEHVIAETRAVTEALLLNCPRVRVLATSRESLRVAGERAYRLPSLSVPSPGEAHRIGAGDALSCAAIALFVDRALAVNHRFTLTDESAPVVAKLCRSLDGIPLAIELAAARVNVLSVQALSDRLNDRLGILVGDKHKSLPRQQTMRAAIDWSYDLLSAREQRVLESLSAFAGGCTLAAAAAVYNSEEPSEHDALDVLSSLVNKSLLIVDFDGCEPRYRLLESFRDYARERLAVRGGLEAAVHRHAFVCLELGEQLQRTFDSGAHELWRALVRKELDNWRTALRWTLTERGDVVLGQRLVGQLHLVWKYFARVEGRRWIASALELVDDATPPSVLASLTFGEATDAWALREYKRALRNSERAIKLYRFAGDSLGVARAQDIATFTLLALGRFAESEFLAREILAFARKSDNQMLAASAMRALAIVATEEGDVATARSYIADVLHLYDSLGAKADAANTLNELAHTEFRAGNVELALRHATDAFARCGDFDDPSAAMDLRTEMAKYLVDLARYDEAEQRARETLSFARERHEDVLAAFALLHLAAIVLLRPLGETERAADVRSQAGRILGFSDARIAKMGSVLRVDERPMYDRALIALREAVGADMAARLVAEGAAMPEEQAVEEALGL